MAQLFRPEKILQFSTLVLALAGTPVMMFGAFGVFGPAVAERFHISNFSLEYLEAVITGIVLLAVIWLWPVPRAHVRVLALLWLIRLGVTLGAMLAFEARYPGDMGLYYFGGKALSDPLAYMEFGNGTRNIQAIVGLIAELTGGYNAIKVVFAYFGLVATYIFYRAATVCIGGDRIVILYALGLLPSLLFWSSLLGKDSVVLLGIAIYCYGAAGLIVRRKLSMLVYVGVGLLIASFIRIWLGVIFAAPLIFAYVLVGRSSPLLKIGFMIVAVPAFFLTLQGFADKFRLETARDLVATTDHLAQAWARGGSAQRIDVGFDSITSMIAFVPIGAFTALFRPLPFEVPNMFGWFAGLENAFILALLLLGLFRRGIVWLSQPVLLWAVAVLVCWAAAYGFVSYQNLGTAFRFRVQVVPLLFLLSLYLAYAHRLRPQDRSQPQSPRVIAGGRDLSAAAREG